MMYAGIGICIGLQIVILLKMRCVDRRLAVMHHEINMLKTEQQP
jgi:hypothetical protein